MFNEKIGFFKKIILSITNFDFYKVIAGEKAKESIIYILKIIILFSLILGTVMFITGSTYFDDEMSAISNINFTRMYDSSIASFLFIFASLLMANIILIFMFVLTLFLVTYLLCYIMRLPIKKRALMNISIYSHTLPIILNLIYLILNIYLKIEIEYFDIMYTGIAMVYAITAIFLIKSDYLKSQMMFTKIIEETEKRMMEEDVGAISSRPEKKKEEEKKEDEKKNKEDVPGVVEEGGKA